MRRNKSINDLLCEVVKDIEYDKRKSSGITATYSFEGTTFQVSNQHERHMLEMLLRTNGTKDYKIRYEQ